MSNNKRILFIMNDPSTSDIVDIAKDMGYTRPCVHVGGVYYFHTDDDLLYDTLTIMGCRPLDVERALHYLPYAAGSLLDTLTDFLVTREPFKFYEKMGRRKNYRVTIDIGLLLKFLYDNPSYVDDVDPTKPIIDTYLNRIEKLIIIMQAQYMLISIECTSCIVDVLEDNKVILATPRPSDSWIKKSVYEYLTSEGWIEYFTGRSKIRKA